VAETAQSCRADINRVSRVLPGESNSTDRIEVLDGIRGLAALSVALSHCVLNVVGLNVWAHARIFDIWDLNADQVIRRLLVDAFPSTAAVLIFFVLSGHVLWRSFVRNKLGTGDALDYLCARTFRLYPLVLVTIIPYGVLQSASWKQVLANMLLLSNSLNGVLWSLQVEIVGSVVIFAIWLWSGSNTFKLLVCLFGLASVVPIFGHETIIMYLPAFALGASISAVSTYVWRSRGLLYCALAVLMGTPLFLGQGLNVSNFFAALAAMAIIGCVEVQRPRFLQSRLAIFLGAISYPFYLLHPVGIQLADPFVRAATHNAFLQMLLFAITSLTLTIPLAWVLHVTVEMPALKSRPRFRRAQSTFRQA
jgi:peptidoglycan/LPS O-acetylase OafA/YrhL